MLHRRQFLGNSLSLMAASLAPGVALAVARSRADRLHIGAQTNAWGVPIKNYDQLLRILENLVQLGYQGFETNFLALESHAGEAARCRRDFESRKIRFVAPHCPFTKLYDKATINEELEKIRRIARYSAEMGASFLILSFDPIPHQNRKLDVDRVRTKGEALNKVGRICNELGLKFCYHNEDQEFQDEPSEMSFLLSETDSKLVWLNYDVGNAYGFGPDAGTFSAQHFRRIIIYHIKDVVPDSKGNLIPTDLGAGKIDLKAVVAPLLDSNWEGWLVVEREAPESQYGAPVGRPEEEIRQSRAYLKQIVGV